MTIGTSDRTSEPPGEMIWRTCREIVAPGLVRTENIFAAGASSLDAAKLAYLLSTQLGMQVTPKDIFANPTVETLTGFTEAVLWTPQPVTDNHALSGLRGLGPRKNARTSMNQQQRLIRDARQERALGRRLTQHVSATYEIVGRLDVAALRVAFHMVNTRHQVLRSIFPSEVRVDIADQPLALLTERDFRTRTSTELERAVEDECARPFDLARGPCLRATVFRADSERWVLVIVFDHLIMDGSGISLFAQQLGDMYSNLLSGRPQEIDEIEVDYYDWSDWLRGYLDSDHLKGLLGEWRADLGDSEPDLTIKWSKPVNFTGDPKAVLVHEAFPSKTGRLINTWSTNTLATPFSVMVATFARAVSSLVANREIPAIIVPVDNRPTIGTRNIIGWMSGLSMVPCASITSVPLDEAIRTTARGVAALERRGVVPLSVLLPVQRQNLKPPPWPVLDMHDGSRGADLMLADLQPRAYQAEGRPRVDNPAPGGIDLTIFRPQPEDYRVTTFYDENRTPPDTAADIIQKMVQDIHISGA